MRHRRNHKARFVRNKCFRRKGTGAACQKAEHDGCEFHCDSSNREKRVDELSECLQTIGTFCSVFRLLTCNH